MAIYLLVGVFVKVLIALAMFQGEDNLLLTVFQLCCV